MVLVIVAHSDDEAIGCGGTIAKYTKAGEKVTVVILSFGEGSQPLIKDELVKKTRIKEAQNVSRYLGVERTIFLGIPDLKINSKNKEDINKVKAIIEKYKPSKIFTHSTSDPHKDHRETNKLVLEATKGLDYSVYTFGVWNPIYIRDTNVPRLFVDVSETFEKKLKALKLFKSQRLSVYQLLPNIFLKAKIAGISNHCKYAEVFYKVK
tara:strand:- start:634 stop:1257 length:624 start_codon:yes stop_codon:yes gene_type:complete